MQGPVVLSVDAFDPAGAGGVQADQRTIERLGGRIVAALTAVLGGSASPWTSVHDLPAPIVKEQLDAAFSTAPPGAARVGLLTSVPVIRAIGRALLRSGVPLVLEPAVAARAGPALLGRASVEAVRRCLLPGASVVVLGADEAALFAGREVRCDADAKAAARAVQLSGAGAVVVRGTSDASGITGLGGLLDGRTWHRLPPGSRVGPGLSFGAAVAFFLARGETAPDAVERAFRFVGAEAGTAPT